MYPPVGNRAPSFSAPDADGNIISLSDYCGKKIIVLYFYPKDNTSGCTKQACGFRDSYDLFQDKNIQLLGVSPDSSASHRKFADKHQLPFPLISDQDKQICEAYGVWQEKSMYGRKYMGVARTTFVIDKKCRIAQVFEKVKPAGHDQEVLEWIRANL